MSLSRWTLPSLFTFTAAAPSSQTPLQSTSGADSTPSTSSLPTPIPHRFPAPPARPAHSLSYSPERTLSSGHKRERGWMPSLRSNQSLNETSEGVAAEPMLSPGSAEGAFDTPSRWLARVGAAREEEEQEEEEEEGDRPAKKRRGVAGTVLSGALDAALFTTSLTFAAYQLWRNPPSAHEDVDAILSSRPSTSSSRSAEAPPPYAELNPNRASPTPSLIPRRVRHAHLPRQRHSSRRILAAPSPPLESTTLYDPFSSHLLLSQPLPQFQPLEVSEDGLLEGSDDEEMRAVAERLEALINSGREALVSDWRAPPAASPAVRYSTPRASHSRKPSSNDTPRSPTRIARGKAGGMLEKVGGRPRSSWAGSMARSGGEVGGSSGSASEAGSAQVDALEGVLQRATKNSGNAWWES